MVFSDFFLLTFKGSDKMGKKTPAGGSTFSFPCCLCPVFNRTSSKDTKALNNAFKSLSVTPNDLAMLTVRCP